MVDKQKEVTICGKTFKIDSDIEKEPRYSAGWNILAKEMKTGDSVLMDDKDARNFAAWCRSRNIKSTTRKIDGEGVRVWRL